jgi:hypothetical protein
MYNFFLFLLYAKLPIFSMQSYQNKCLMESHLVPYDGPVETVLLTLFLELFLAGGWCCLTIGEPVKVRGTMKRVKKEEDDEVCRIFKLSFGSTQIIIDAVIFDCFALAGQKGCSNLSAPRAGSAIRSVTRSRQLLRTRYQTGRRHF